MEREVERQKQEARELDKAKQRRALWLAGAGDPHDEKLEMPKSEPSQNCDGVVIFQSYDNSGELIEFEFEHSDKYGDWVDERVKYVKLQCNNIESDFLLYLKIDKNNVDQTWDEAGWYQKPGLAVANPGISKVAIMFGVQGLLFCKRALVEVDKADNFIRDGRGSPAGRALNDALRLQLKATHAYNTMKVRHAGDNDGKLERLQNISTAGDVASNFVPGVGQVGTRVFKNAAVRGATMHSDPDAEFGMTDFLWQTAGDVAGYKAQSFVAGRDPGFFRTAAGGIANNQVTAAISSRDPSKLVEFDPLATALTIAGASASAYFRQRQGQSQGGSFSSLPDNSPGTRLPAIAPPPVTPVLWPVPPTPKPGPVTAHAGGAGDDFSYQTIPVVPPKAVGYGKTGVTPEAASDNYAPKQRPTGEQVAKPSMVDDYRHKNELPPHSVPEPGLTVVERPPPGSYSNAGFSGDLGEAAEAAGAGAKTLPKTYAKHVSAASRQDLREIFSTHGDDALRVFTNRLNLPNNGLRQVEIPTSTGVRRVDRFFGDDGAIVLREVKNYQKSTLKNTPRIAAELKKDLEILGRYPYSRVEWHLTGNASKVFVNYLKILELMTGGRFRVIPGKTVNIIG